jgi:chondroitin AC lyase
MKKTQIFLLLFIISFNNFFYAQLIPSLKQHIFEINRKPFYQQKEQHQSASEISNKGNTSDLSLRELYLFTYQEKSDLENLLKLQKSDGSFPDIQYNDTALSNWDPTNHALRLLFLSRAYITPSSEFYQKKEVSEYLHRGINFWFRANLTCRNWWYNEIGVPRTMGLVFLFMENELSPTEKEGAIKVMNHSTFRQTGQNKVWQAGNIFLKALLINDEKLAQQARDTIASEIFQTTNEGIQPDFSFHQHGPQQQFGNYGLAYISSMAYYANVFESTKFAFSNDQIKILRNYVLDGENWVVWRGYFDVSACNRQLFKQAQFGKMLTLCVAVNLMKSADPEFSDSYDNMIIRNLQPGVLPEKTGAKHFWRSDLSVFRSASNYISIRSCSPRVKGTEFTNKENKKGHYLSDGSTIILRNGDEYKDIFPIWDWNKLPGITAPLVDAVKAHTKGDEYRNSNPFVGGLANGNNGITTFHLARNKVDAHKSWFYLKGMLICLGSNIKSTSGNEIFTDVNQCLQKGKAIFAFSGGRTESFSDTILQSRALKTVWHDSIGYCFLKPTSATLSVKTQTGNWHEIADPYSTEKITGKVFNLWINHGVNCAESNSYEYVVLPSVSQAGLKEFANQPTLDVLANSRDIQAVKSKDNLLFQFVFHKQGKIQTFSATEFLEAKTLGLIQVEKNSENQLTLTVAEPSQSKKTFRIGLTGEYSAECATYNPTTNQTEIRIKLPKGGEAGKCVTVMLQKKL